MSPVRLENSTLTPLACHRLGGGDDQLERQDDQAEADEYPAELAEAGLFAAEEENHAEEDQQWRQPRQVEGQHPRHQRGADIGAEHDRQGRRQCHQALGDEGGGQQGGGVAALHQSGDADAGGERQRAFFHAATEDAPQVGAVDPENSGADDMRAPHQQGDGREQVEQFQHGVAPGTTTNGQPRARSRVRCAAEPGQRRQRPRWKGSVQASCNTNVIFGQAPPREFVPAARAAGRLPFIQACAPRNGEDFSPSVRCMRLRHRPWN